MSAQPGSITPGSNNELIVTGIVLDFNGANTLSINSSFTISDQLALVPGADFQVGMAYLVQGSAGAINPTWSWPNSSTVAVPIASFKSASATLVAKSFIYSQAVQRSTLR